MIQALEHLAPHHQELRKRLIYSFIAIALTTVIAYGFVEKLVELFLQPLFAAYPPPHKLVYTKLTEAFVVYLKVALLTGLFLSFPYLLYQAWMFVSPGLLAQEKKLAAKIILGSALLFLSGALFAYFVALPRMLVFFLSYAGPQLIPLPQIGLYLTFVGRTIFAFGIAFEIPFLMAMAGKSGLVNPGHFQRKRRYFYLAIVIVSFLLTAGDPTACVLMSLPLFGLYEIGAWFATSVAKPSAT